MTLQRFRRARRVSSAVLAVVFTAAATLVCLPSPVAGVDHCASMAMATVEEGHCETPAPAMDCCATPEQSPSLPTPHTVARADTAAASAPLPAGLLPESTAVPRASVFRDAPVHGYRSVDLPTLNAAFLI